ncbi:MAG TPA: PIG-L deacetylase family protein [Bacteroidia bacterium]|nr:PIG-L deacetylase family protein [Bacteroidia bacterium]
MAKIVVIAAHPDDEIIGCGGTLLKHRSNGDEVFWIIITGVSSQSGFSKERVESRAQEINKVAGEIGFSGVHQLGYPPMEMDSTTMNKLIPKLSVLFNQLQPEVIYVMNRSDAHSDHRVTFDAVMACTKSFRYPFIKKVLMYECISETEFAPALPEKVFQPNYYVDVSSYMKKKLELMNVYESEVGAHPFPRSIRNLEALAVFRGASVGVEYAEAFQLIKFIDK